MEITFRTTLSSDEGEDVEIYAAEVTDREGGPMILIINDSREIDYGEFKSDVLWVVLEGVLEKHGEECIIREEEPVEDFDADFFPDFDLDGEGWTDIGDNDLPFGFNIVNPEDDLDDGESCGC